VCAFYAALSNSFLTLLCGEKGIFNIYFCFIFTTEKRICHENSASTTYEFRAEGGGGLVVAAVINN